MTTHLPYILGAYLAFFIVMGWTAVMPLIQGRKIRQLITRYHRNRNQDDSHS